MEKMFKNEEMVTPYESPLMIEIQIPCEGVLCQSGTEKFENTFGEW